MLPQHWQAKRSAVLQADLPQGSLASDAAMRSSCACALERVPSLLAGSVTSSSEESELPASASCSDKKVGRGFSGGITSRKCIPHAREDVEERAGLRRQTCSSRRWGPCLERLRAGVEGVLPPLLLPGVGGLGADLRRAEQSSTGAAKVLRRRQDSQSGDAPRRCPPSL